VGNGLFVLSFFVAHFVMWVMCCVVLLVMFFCVGCFL